MPDQSRQKRFLIATGVTTGLVKSADRLIASVGRTADIFQGSFDYERVTSLDLNPSADQMRHELRAFAMKCHPDDIVTLYHTGHADVIASRHRLWMGDTDDPVINALPTSELAELLLADNSPVSNLLIILDTCFAAQGGTEALLTAIKAAGNFEGKTLLAIMAAHPKQQVRAGDFARLFERSVDHPATAGYEPRYLSPSAVVGHMNKDPERMAWQTVSYSTVLGTDEAPFLPNPRYDAAFHGFDLATQLQMEQDEQRREDIEKFFNPRARGVDVPQEAGWNFVGRHAALHDLTAWLSDPKDLRTVVVTGDPGSGKSAVIGRLYILSHADWGRTVPRQGLPADTIPPTGSIDVAIHARNRTSEEVLQALCAAARVRAATPGEFLRALAGKPMVAAVDAIDEAVDADRLVSGILNPLVDAGPRTGFRMLLGTRSYLLDRLSAAADRIDLDDHRYADPDSLCVYVAGRLLVPAGSSYAAADPGQVHAVADAVAQAAGRSFLVALITSRTLAARPRVADPQDPEWRASLPGTAAQAMHQDLEARLGDGAAQARDLLRPLAYALGSGLPWEDLWAPLASLLAGRDYRDEHLMWLRRSGGSYVVEALESGRSVYRLYHAALADYLRQGQDETRVHGEFVSFLLDHVPRNAAGEREWPAAHPYILSHLATHAAAAGELERVIADPGFLACAAPLGLLAAFPTVRDANTRLIAAAYERAVHQLRSNDLADRLSYLELAARRARAASLAERIETYPVPRRWSVGWVQWPPDHPHRVLAGHRGPVNEVVGIGTADGPQAASVGDDGTLRLWDLGTAEPTGIYKVSRAPLTAIDLVELPGPQLLAIMLSSGGFLTAYELSTMTRVLDIPIQPGVRRVLRILQLARPKMRCMRLPDGRLAAVTGGAGVIATIWDIRTGTPIVRLRSGLQPARLEFRELVSGDPVVISVSVTDWQRVPEQVFDLRTGRQIPGLRSMFGAPRLDYFCSADGRPALAVRGADLSLHGTLVDILSGRRSRQTIFDLTGPPGQPTRKLRMNGNAPVELHDGRSVRLIYDESERSWLPYRTGFEEPEFFALSDTVRGSVGLSSAGSAVHARPSSTFPYVVALDGRAITLSPTSPASGPPAAVVLTGHSGRVTDADVVALPGRPAALLSSSLDGTVRDWDVTDIRPDSGDGQAVDLSDVVVATLTRQGRTIGVTIAAGKLRDAAIIDLHTGETIGRLDCPSSAIWAATCGWVPDIGDAAITFDDWGSAQFWSLPSGDHVAHFLAYPDLLPTQAAYLPLPGRPLAVTSGHGEKAIIWDLVDRRIHDVFGRHKGWTSAVASGVTRNGTLLAATGGQDNRINLWDVVRGRRVGHFKMATRAAYLRSPQSGHASAVSLSMVGNRRPIVLVLSDDGKLRAFQKRRWRPGYGGAVLSKSRASSLATMRLADGRTLAVTGGEDGRLRAWDLEAALTAIGRGETDIPATLVIETDVAITGVSVAGDDTIVTSTFNGLAAFRLHPEHLPRPG